MFSPVLAANNNHMLDLLPNVYFISSLVHDEGSGKKKKRFHCFECWGRASNRGPRYLRQKCSCPTPAGSGCHLTLPFSVRYRVSPLHPRTRGSQLGTSGLYRSGGAGMDAANPVAPPAPGHRLQRRREEGQARRQI